MAAKTILMVEDNPKHRALYGRQLKREGYEVLERESAEEALEALPEEVAAVVTDMNLPGMNGAALMERLHQSRPNLPVIILTNSGDLQQSLDVLDQGAFDYVQKTEGFRDFTLRVARAVKHGSLAREVDQLRRQIARQGEIVPSSSKPMLEALQRVDAVAGTTYPVLLLGESGTGKELIARQIHRKSNRSGHPFVTVNCGAIPQELFESQLFGHRKGAFTGATRDQSGLFEDADGGTLFLDEIGEIAPMHQVKLLRALQEGEVQRIGDSRPEQVDVRIVAATNQDLADAVRQGTFREDLFYRLNVMPIQLPPLRARREDIVALAEHFLQTAMAETGRTIEGFSPEALAALRAHNWPGNIRELQNKVRQALIVCRAPRIHGEDLALEDNLDASEEFPAAWMTAPLAEARQRFERRYLEELLRRHDGNITKAAEETGKHRSELYTLLKRHSLKPDDYRG